MCKTIKPAKPYDRIVMCRTLSDYCRKVNAVAKKSVSVSVYKEPDQNWFTWLGLIFVLKTGKKVWVRLHRSGYLAVE